TTAAISQIAAQLEQKELVERYSMPGDRRTVYVRITDKGREFYEAEVRHSQEMMQKAIEQMGEERAAQYLALSREFQQIVREL
ncbi:MAG: MarR family transcriptional regulator, partial [Firmicutes bacterium]|nr:MarR family transcriptional regulator [Bacillota bacterium]